MGKHVSSLALYVIQAMNKAGRKPVHVEGLNEGDWVVIDYLDVVIHLLTSAVRDKYRLEELWQEGKIVDLDLVIHKQDEELEFWHRRRL